MSKKKKKKIKGQRQSNEKAPRVFGLDFGSLQKIMALSDMDFNQKLRNSGISGCGYGFVELQGFGGPIPCLTLLVTNQKAIESAYEHFKRWGCETDGDSVDIHILLRRNKSYEMSINPEINRSLYRTVLHTDLVEPIIMNTSYIKKFDSTSDFLFKLKKEIDTSSFQPIAINFGVCPPHNIDPSAIHELVHLPYIIKFNLVIDFENADGSNPRFGEHKNMPKPNHANSPSDYCIKRKKVINWAFPITQ